MMAPSDLYRIPPAPSRRTAEDLARWANREYGATSLAWAVPAVGAAESPRLGLWQRLASYLRTPVRASVPAQSMALRTGLAAVHFGGDLPDATSAATHGDLSDHPCDILATSALILPVQPNQPCSDEACVCEH